MRASVFVFFRLSIVTRAPSLCIYNGNCGYRGLRHSSRDRHHATVYGSGVGLRRYSVFIIRDSPQHAAAKHRGGSTKTGRWRAAFTATALELSSANLLFFVPCRCCCCTMEPDHCSWMDSPVREGAALCSPFSGGKPRPRWFTLVFCLPITMAWCLLWILLIALYAIVSAQNNAVDNYIRIDCGGSVDFTNNINETWMSDKYFTGGAPATVLDPGQFVQQQERTVRFFPIAMGKKNCYVVNVPNGRYFIRMFFVYDDYDRQQHSPSFDVSVEGTVVFSWRNPWQDYFAQNGAYSDLFAFIHDGAATVCFYSIATDSPVIGALELLEVDELSYDSQSTGESVILVNYGRLMTGYESFGPGFTNDTDELGRGWEQDDFYSFSPKSVLTTTQNILNTTLPPNYFPEKLYQACRSLAEGGSINYVFEVDSNLDYAIWLHFAEIDPSVKAQGQRVFDVRINNQVVLPSLDIYKLAGGPFSAYDWHFTVVNLTGSSLTIDFEAKIGPPLICGLEVYALLTADLTTKVTEAMAMQALRMSLNVPERMGWNGDPCAPTRWDPWEGVTCNLAVDKSGLIITNLNISGQGLQGFISDQITLLTHLTTLNLSNNMLGGSIPAGLGLNSLTSVDLSGNLLTGNIPASLGSQQLRQLLLSNNQLSGQVPIPIYSMGVHGGFINLSSNAGLCGVPSLPKCPPFWRGGLSTGSKIGIVIGTSTAVLAVVILVYFYLKRHSVEDDYNFNLPNQLAARTKWYQNHRMSVHEAEDEHILQPHLSTKFGFSSNIAPL